MPLVGQHNDSERTQRKTAFRNATVCLKLTQQEVKLLDQLATAKGVARSEWIPRPEIKKRNKAEGDNVETHIEA